ncbi:MAG: hypothetical protein ACHQO8_12455, partial [Vicinamibacterales bacterium]
MKLTRFGVVPSPDRRHVRLERAVVAHLDACGCVEAPLADAVDFVVRCGPSPSPTNVRPAFGVWSFAIEGGDPIGWRAYAEGRLSASARLVSTVEGGDEVVLREGMLPIASSYRATEDALIDLLARWPARAAAEIEAGGWSTLPRRREPSAPAPAPPTLAERIRTPLTHPWWRLRGWWLDMARYDTWNVGIVTLDEPPRDIDDLAQLAPIRWLPPRPALY